MNYQADNLKVLKGLEPVKQTPGMFIGDTNINGLHQIIWEPLDNSIDEALAGFCSKIEVILDKNGYVELKDNGRGIPTDIHKEEGISGVELVLTRLHAGGKFKRTGGAYKTSGGLHGVGVSCTNALSEHLIATVEKDGKVHQMEFERGFPKGKLEVIGTTKNHGTSIKFKPDSTVFEVLEFDRKLIENRLKQLAYLNQGLTIQLTDTRNVDNIFTKTFYYENGLKEFLGEMIGEKETIFEETLLFDGTQDDIEVRIALNYFKNEWDEKCLAFANNIYNKDGGTHVMAFNRQLSGILSKYAEDLYSKRKELPTLEDYKQGLIAIISIKLPNPRFLSQTKDKLTSTEVTNVINAILKDKLVQFFDENPTTLKSLLEKSFRALEARLAAKRAREAVQKNDKELFIKNEKFIDCISKNVAERELFLVEGDSAGGSARTGRDRNTQAILSLRGKPKNTQDLTLSQILTNEEFNQLIGVLGCGIKDSFDLSKLRYDKVILMCLGGETRIHTLDGEHLTIKELAEKGESVGVWALINNEIKPIIVDPPRKTRTCSKWLSLTFSDGTSLECTHNHRFVVNNPDRNDSRIIWVKQSDGVEIPMIKAEDLTSADQLVQKIEYALIACYNSFSENSTYNIQESQESSNFETVKSNILIKEEIRGEKDFYCFTIPGISNFMLANGIISGNCDADVDGSHINILLLTFFFQQYRTLIEEGKIYVAVPPLYRVRTKKGNEYIQDDSALTVYKQKYGMPKDLGRFKGLGEMNAKELAESTMNPDKRTLIQVTIEEAEKVARAFEDLMGKMTAHKRRELIEEKWEIADIDV